MTGNDGWANFPTTGTEAMKEQDDDWDDFGGFETAQPVTDPQGSTTSGLISWATTLGAQPSSAEQQKVDPPDMTQGTELVMFPSEPMEIHQHLEKTTQELTNTAVLPSPEAIISEVISDGLTVKSDSVKQDTDSLQRYNEELQKAGKVINDLEGKLSLDEQEKLRLKKELENLMRKHQELQDMSKSVQESLDDQKQKYRKLRAEHQQQLQGIRQAGHDALAIIVEEYKELSKQAVLEERKQSQSELQNFLENERKKFQEILTQQQENFERTLAEEREKSDERVKTVLQEEEEKHNLATESALNKEREEFERTLEKSIKETREQGEEAVKAAVAKEKDMHLELMEKMEKTMEEEREKFRNSLKEALIDERQQTKRAVQEALVEERAKSRETISQSIEETKLSMNEYIREKQELDSQVQQKQYLAMDLFLESARTQLKSLMEGNQKS